MTSNELTLMALEAAADLTGEPVTDLHTQDVGFHLFCAVLAKELADRGLTSDDLTPRAMEQAREWAFDTLHGRTA